MATKEEKKVRKAKGAELKKQARANLEQGLPIGKVSFEDLFDHLDRNISSAGCDHTLLHTRRFLSERSLPEEITISWLAEHGGYCDCEVLANVEDLLNEIR